MADNRKLQLFRSNNIYATRDEALSALTPSFVNSRIDGEVVALRYKKEGGSADEANTMLVVFAEKNGTKSYTIIDSTETEKVIEDTREQLGETLAAQIAELSGFTEEEFADVENEIICIKTMIGIPSGETCVADPYNGKQYISGATDMLDALNKLDDAAHFTPLSPDVLQVPTTLGDIKQGTTAAQLKGKSYQELMDSILFPTIYPTINTGVATIAFSATFTNDCIIKAGSAGPANTNFSYTYSGWTAHVDDGVTTDKKWRGDASSVSYVVTFTPGAANANAGVSASGSTLNKAALSNTASMANVGTYKYEYNLYYKQGDTLQTSKGTTPNPMPTTNKGNITNPTPSGFIPSTNSVIINVSLPLYTNSGTTQTTATAESVLRKWGAMTYTGVKFPDTDAVHPIIIETPRKLQSINSYNALNGKYDVEQIGNFAAPTSVNKTINGMTFPYFQYKWNGNGWGSVNYEIKTY